VPDPGRSDSNSYSSQLWYGSLVTGSVRYRHPPGGRLKMGTFPLECPS
jgi:hypothetical protein